jgi:hypothetical protein
VSQEAINFLNKCIWANSPDIFTLNELRPKSTTACLDFNQVAMPMVHPTTGETISSYKRLMHDPTKAGTWETAFGKYFGGMVQGNLKMRQKGTNSIFGMMHDEIPLHPQNTDCDICTSNDRFLPTGSQPPLHPHHSWWEFDQISRGTLHPNC